MNFTHKSPKWDNVGAEPTEELIKKGFTAGYKPPASFFNWFWNRVSNCIKEIQEKLGTVEEHANNYEHPTKHTADMITQDEVHRFVSDNKIEEWNNKLSTNDVINNLDSTDTTKPLSAAMGTELKKSVSDGKKTVANAITAKGQATEQTATFQTMADNISKIQTGVNTSDATALNSDILSNKTAYVKGSKVTGSMPNYTSQTGTTNIANSCLMYNKPVWNDVNMLLDIKSGYYAGDHPIGYKVPNLTPENIKAGVQVSSNPASNSGLIGTFTNDATATASDIAQGKTAYVKGSKITGINKLPITLDIINYTLNGEIAINKSIETPYFEYITEGTGSRNENLSLQNDISKIAYAVKSNIFSLNGGSKSYIIDINHNIDMIIVEYLGSKKTIDKFLVYQNIQTYDTPLNVLCRKGGGNYNLAFHIKKNRVSGSFQCHIYLQLERQEYDTIGNTFLPSCSCNIYLIGAKYTYS